MADRAIPFFGPMVRALLEGRKTQTRRVMRLPYGYSHAIVSKRGLDGPYFIHIEPSDDDRPARHLPKSFETGDRLWVREAWRTWAQYDAFPPRALEAGTHISYEATPDAPNLGNNAGKYRPGMFMPRWASRLTLTVTDVRVQRLQEISEEDAKAEGCGMRIGPAPFNSYRSGFESLWDSLNAKRGFGWDQNPWVAAYTFTVHRCNIDQMEAA